MDAAAIAVQASRSSSLRAGEELAERLNEFLEVPLLVQVGVKQGQIVRGQVAAWGIEVALPPANGFECSGHVHAEERATPRSRIVADTVRYLDSPETIEPIR